MKTNLEPAMSGQVSLPLPPWFGRWRDAGRGLLDTGTLVPAASWVARGITGRFEIWREGVSYASMRGDIEKAAKLDVSEEAHGPVFRPKRQEGALGLANPPPASAEPSPGAEQQHHDSLKQLIGRPPMDDFPIDREANQLALQACAQAATILGWPNKTNLSEAEIEILRRKSEEKAIELRDQISDPAKRPRLAALRKAIKGCIFFEDEVQAAELDRAWFSKNDDHRFRVRAALPHEIRTASSKRISLDRNRAQGAGWRRRV